MLKDKAKNNPDSYNDAIQKALKLLVTYWSQDEINKLIEATRKDVFRMSDVLKELPGRNWEAIKNKLKWLRH